MQCPSCKAESTGRFCSRCGTRLDPGACADCGATLVPGARYCTQCGARTPDVPGATGASAAGRATGGADGRGAGSSQSGMPWYIAGGLLVLLILVLALPRMTGRGADAGQPAAVTGPGGLPSGAGSPPPLTGTPREQADRLFNRIMIARDQGDMTEVLRFTPMAIQAYAMAAPLDDDGLYHLATVHIVAGDHTAALATANRVLDRNANHLLALGTAAEAAELAGDHAAARAYHQRFLDAYDAESGRDLPEYMDHSRILPTYRAAAERGVGR